MTKAELMEMMDRVKEQTASDIVKALREAEYRGYMKAAADRPQEWIPCSERLPNRQGHYICTCKDGSKYKRTTVVKWSNGWQLTGARMKGADDEVD